MFVIVSQHEAEEIIVIGPVGVGTRPILGIRIRNDYFFNIHAGAHVNNEVPDAVGAIEAHMSGILDIERRTTWIIMGNYYRVSMLFISLYFH